MSPKMKPTETVGSIIDSSLQLFLMLNEKEDAVAIREMVLSTGSFALLTLTAAIISVTYFQIGNCLTFFFPRDVHITDAVAHLYLHQDGLQQSFKAITWHWHFAAYNYYHRDGLAVCLPSEHNVSDGPNTVPVQVPPQRTSSLH